MPTPPDDPRITELISNEQIAALAILYDRFAHALDPLSRQRDEAERVFLQEVADLYDTGGLTSISYHEFRKAVIVRCKRHLLYNRKISTV